MEDNRIKEEEILSGLITPTSQRLGKGENYMSINRKHNRLYFSKPLLFTLGFPKKIAVSAANGSIFIIPEPKRADVNTVGLKAGGDEKHTTINNASVVAKICDTLAISEKANCNVKEYMKIADDTVYEVTIKR